MPIKRTTPLATGDTFTFAGLPESKPDDPTRTITVLDIGVDGRVYFDSTWPSGASATDSAPLTDVLAMIGHGIWQRA